MRLAELLSGFIGSCGFDPPFHMVAIGANGAISVSLCKASGSATELCNTGGCAPSCGTKSLRLIPGLDRRRLIIEDFE